MTASVNPQPTATRDGVALAPLADGFLSPYRERLHLIERFAAPTAEDLAAAQAPGGTPPQDDRAPRATGPFSGEALAAMDAWSAPFGEPEESHVITEDREIEGPHGPVPVRVYRPEPGWEPTMSAVPDGEGRLPGLVWFHGGAFVGGDLDMPEADLVARGITTRTGVTVVSVFYRLCHGGIHYPVPHDDCYAALHWTVDNATALGIDAARIAVGGASAGGNLAAGVVLRARDEAGTTPVWQALLAYPVAHAGHWPEPSAQLARCLERMPQILRFPAEVMEAMNANFLGEPVHEAPAYAFVGDGHGSAADLTGWPSTYIENCENDDLRASGEALARRLAAAGVDVECVTCAGVPHGHLNAVGSPLTSQSLDRFAARLRRRA